MADENQANERLAYLEDRIVALHAAVFGLAGRFAPEMELAPLDGEDTFDTNLRLIGQIAAIEGAPGEVVDPRIAGLEHENAELRASLTATRGHATRAKNEVAVLRAERSPTPRKVGRPRGAFGKAGEAYSPDLAAIAIGGEESVEIVFSDGKAEIVDLPPVTAFAHAWLPRGGRHMLREPVELEGGDADLEVAGAALLSGGEQIGWCEFPEPVRVPKHGRVRLENCLTF